MSDQKIPLSDMIQQLREEMEQSQKNALNSKMKFLLDSIEIELSIAISKEGEGHAGIKFWVVDAGGAYKQKDETTHKFKLVLKPGPGSDVYVSDESQSQTERK